MKTVVVASENPVKGKATLAGLRRMFPDSDFRLRAVSVPSGVGHQPMSEAETRRGARERARAAQAMAPKADFWVGIEGGIDDTSEGMLAYAWVVVRSKAMEGLGRTGSFLLPGSVASLVRQGKELGEANDLVFGRENSKQQEGAIGLLTGNVIDRAELYEQGVVLALAPIKSSTVYGSGAPKT